MGGPTGVTWAVTAYVACPGTTGDPGAATPVAAETAAAAGAGAAQIPRTRELRLAAALPAAMRSSLFHRSPFTTPIVLPSPYGRDAAAAAAADATGNPNGPGPGPDPDGPGGTVVVRELLMVGLGVDSDNLGAGPWLLRGLVRLDLSRNLMEELDPAVGRLTLLEELDLSRNRLRE